MDKQNFLQPNSYAQNAVLRPEQLSENGQNQNRKLLRYRNLRKEENENIRRHQNVQLIEKERKNYTPMLEINDNTILARRKSFNNDQQIDLTNQSKEKLSFNSSSTTSPITSYSLTYNPRPLNFSKQSKYVVEISKNSQAKEDIKVEHKIEKQKNDQGEKMFKKY